MIVTQVDVCIIWYVYPSIELYKTCDNVSYSHAEEQSYLGFSVLIRSSQWNASVWWKKIFDMVAKEYSIKIG